MPAQISLGKSDQARLARIAREAGKTREEVLRFILDHGLGTAALILGKVAASRAAAARGEVIPHDAAMRRAHAVLVRHAAKPKIAA